MDNGTRRLRNALLVLLAATVVLLALAPIMGAPELFLLAILTFGTLWRVALRNSVNRDKHN